MQHAVTVPCGNGRSRMGLTDGRTSNRCPKFSETALTSSVNLREKEKAKEKNGRRNETEPTRLLVELKLIKDVKV